MGVFQRYKACPKTGEKVLASQKYHYSFRQKDPGSATGKSRQFQGSTGCTSKRAAQTFERRLRAQIAEGDYQRTIAATTVGEVLEKYFADRWADDPRSDEMASILENIVSQIGDDAHISSLKTSTVRSAIRKRAKSPKRVFIGFDEHGEKLFKDGVTISPATVNREFEKLRAAINHACEDDEFDPPNIKWKKVWLKERGEMQTELSEEQSLLYMRALREDYLPFAVFLRTSAKRVREVINLQKSDIRPAEHLVRYRIKGGEEVLQKVSKTQMDILVSQMVLAPGQHVWSQIQQRTYRDRTGKLRRAGRRFPITYETFAAQHRVAKIAAGLPALRIHDLRHDTLTKITRQSNGNIGRAQALAGHKSINTTKRYVHYSGDDQSASAELAEAVLAGIDCYVTTAATITKLKKR